MILDGLVRILQATPKQYIRTMTYDYEPVLVYVQFGDFCVESLWYNDRGDLIRQYYKTAEWLTRRHPYLLDETVRKDITKIPYRPGDPILR